MEYFSGTITLRFIFSSYWGAYCRWFKGKIRQAVRENVAKILKCRTPQLGFHLYQCPKCEAVRVVPHSCKSRFCSSCGKIATDRWTDERLSDILAVGYHHLVFTIPWQLRAIGLINRGVLFDLMFKAAALSLLSWTSEYGGYLPGFYLVLHTFGSDLTFNPHLHALITAGGLAMDRRKWVDAPRDYLMPEKGLKKRWRHNVISGLIQANTEGRIEMPVLKKSGSNLNLRGVIAVIARLSWYVYIGARLAQVGLTVKYIGRYTKKPVLAETRIIHCDDRWIVFEFKDYADGGKPATKKLGLFTFITFLTQHIHDKHFRAVRGYGLFSNRLKGQLLPTARSFLRKSPRREKTAPETWRERTMARTKKDPLVCERCQVEMTLVFVCFVPDSAWLEKLALDPFEKIPTRQINLQPDG